MSEIALWCEYTHKVAHYTHTITIFCRVAAFSPVTIVHLTTLVGCLVWWYSLLVLRALNLSCDFVRWIFRLLRLVFSLPFFFFCFFSSFFRSIFGGLRQFWLGHMGAFLFFWGSAQIEFSCKCLPVSIVGAGKIAITMLLKLSCQPASCCRAGSGNLSFSL